MDLKVVRIQKYRSLATEATITLDGLTVLVGPNNQGKSNVLQAMKLGMDTLEVASLRLTNSNDGSVVSLPHIPRLRQTSWTTRQRPGQRVHYDWSRDFPLQYRDHGGVVKHSSVRFDFILDAEDQRDFLKATGSKNNGLLSAELKFGIDGVEIDFPKRGTRAGSYRKVAKEICRFVCERFKFLYVPAIRTTDQAAHVINELISERMSTLRKNEEYRTLVDNLAEFHDSRLKELKESLGERLRVYLPGFQSLEIQMDSSSMFSPRSSSADSIELDDGTLTSILEKGDGVKSLVTMALLHDLAERGSNTQNVLLAIDEPEAHLHPDAVHQMAQVLREIASKQQVIVATHSASLVNRGHLPNNVIVTNNSVVPVKRISQIRECLGIRPYDNLTSAEFLVLTEGPTDTQFFTALFRGQSQLLREAIDSSTLAITDVIGAGNMPLRVRVAQDMMSEVFVILDKDQSGDQAVTSLLNDGMLKATSIRQLSISGRSRNEVENLFSEELHAEVFDAVVGQPLPAPNPKDLGRTWSDRMTASLSTLGIPGADATLTSLKIAIAKKVAEYPEKYITPEGATICQSIIGGIESLIKQRENPGEISFQ